MYWRYFYHTGIEGTTGPFTIGSDNLFAALRENLVEKKVYAIIFSDTEAFSYTRNPYSNYECALDEEILLYDFSLEIGEEIPDTDFCLHRGIVSSVSNQNVFGEERILQQYNDSSYDEIYEGIGSVTYGLFENFVGSVSGYGVSFYYHCIGTDYECYPDMMGYTSVNELETQISISPNPTTDYLYISTELEEKIQAIRIYNSIGKLVKEVVTDFSKIDIADLSSEMLYIHVQLENESFVRKIIKQ